MPGEAGTAAGTTAAANVAARALSEVQQPRPALPPRRRALAAVEGGAQAVAHGGTVVAATWREGWAESAAVAAAPTTATAPVAINNRGAARRGAAADTAGATAATATTAPVASYCGAGHGRRDRPARHQSGGVGPWGSEGAIKLLGRGPLALSFWGRTALVPGLRSVGDVAYKQLRERDAYHRNTCNGHSPVHDVLSQRASVVCMRSHDYSPAPTEHHTPLHTRTRQPWRGDVPP